MNSYMMKKGDLKPLITELNETDKTMSSLVIVSLRPYKSGQTHTYRQYNNQSPCADPEGGTGGSGPPLEFENFT